MLHVRHSIWLLAPVLAFFAAVPSGTPAAGRQDIAACQQGTPVPGTPTEFPASPSSGTPTNAVPETRVGIGEAEALLWGAGDYGVVLVHGAAYDAASWRLQAQEIARGGMTVLALEEISPDDVGAGIRFLVEACGTRGVAVIGASAGASAALQAATQDPRGLDHLILLSGTGDVTSLGPYPKLFVASEDEGLAETVMAMAEQARGEDNEVLLLPGNAHAQAIFGGPEGERLLQAIIDRLDRYR